MLYKRTLSQKRLIRRNLHPPTLSPSTTHANQKQEKAKIHGQVMESKAETLRKGEKERGREGEREREKEGERERERDRERQTDRDRERQRQADRQRERERQSESKREQEETQPTLIPLLCPLCAPLSQDSSHHPLLEILQRHSGTRRPLPSTVHCHQLLHLQSQRQGQVAQVSAARRCCLQNCQVGGRFIPHFDGQNLGGGRSHHNQNTHHFLLRAWLVKLV